jgi:hypothetical protein
MTREFIASLVALAITSTLATDAQAFHQRAHRRATALDVVGQTQRSYLDPGTSAAVGSEDHYFSDTALYSYNQLGPSISSDRLNFPRQSDPLFRF